MSGLVISERARDKNPTHQGVTHAEDGRVFRCSGHCRAKDVGMSTVAPSNTAPLLGLSQAFLSLP